MQLFVNVFSIFYQLFCQDFDFLIHFRIFEKLGFKISNFGIFRINLRRNIFSHKVVYVHRAHRRLLRPKDIWF